MATVTPIAIIGMAGRFPAANNIDEFWDNLFAGRDCLSDLTDEELIQRGVPRHVLGDPDYVRRRPLVDNPEAIDSTLFKIPPREAELRDPQYRMMLEVAHSALAHGGYDPSQYDGDIGVFAGTNVNRYRYDHIESHIDLLRSVGYFAVDTGNAPDFLTTYISYKLGLRGPSMTVLTACSTSLVAVHMACVAIRAGDCQMALAGGVDLEFPLHTGYRYKPAGIWARDGVPRPFDRDATGTNFGNGSGAVLLKPLVAAQADGDTIYAVIRGSAINNDGNRKVGYSAPSVAGQRACILRALRTAGVDPRTISYVETHGTGTVVGDPIELTALAEAYQQAAGEPLPPQYCRIGSVKSNIGHLGQAAGVAGLIKTVLSLSHKRIPSSIHVEEPNPKIDWASSPFTIATETADWPAGEQPRRAAISSFGVGGTNAHAILEEGPRVAPSTGDRRATEVVVWSAATESAHERLRESLADFFERRPADEFADAAHTTRVGRTPLAHRAAVVAAGAEDAAVALRTPSRVIRPDGVARTLAFAFPGQGSLHTSSLYDLYTEEPLFRQGCDAAFEVLNPLLDLDLRAIWATGDRDELAETNVAQPLVYTIEYTLAHCLMRWGVEPSVLLGHSLGELVAAAVAGVFDFEGGLRAVAARARLMQDMARGRMVAVDATLDDLHDLLDDSVFLAGVNGPRQNVLSGTTEAIDAIAARLSEQGISVRSLATSHAFHSPAMAGAAEEFERELAGISLSEPRSAVISAVTGAEMTVEEACSPRFWARQLVEPVMFDDAVRTVLGNGPSTLIEVGPGRTLTGLLRDRADLTAGRSRALPVAPAKAAQATSTALDSCLARLWVDGQAITYWRELTGRGYRRIAVPGYPYERRRHWIELPVDSDSDANGDDNTDNNGNGNGNGTLAESPVPSEPDTGVLDDEPTPAPGWSLSCQRWTQHIEGHSPVRHAVAPRATAVVLAGNGTGGNLARDALRRAGYRTVPVNPPSTTATATAPDQWAAVLDNTPADLIAHCALLDVDVRVDKHTLAAQLDAGVTSLFACLRAAAAAQRHRRHPISLVVLGRFMVDVTGAEQINPAAASVIPLLYSFATEVPGLRTFCVDVGGAGSVEALSRELGDLSDPLVALRGTSRWLPESQPLPRRADAGQLRVRPQGTYLITGGLGGIGLVTASALADTGLRPRIALVGRYGLPAANTPNGEAARARIDDIVAAGAQVEVVAGDVTDLASLRTAVESVERRFGPVNGVLHAAGVAGGGLAERRDPADAANVLAPKTYGTLNLEEVFADRPELDFLMLFSSRAGLEGMYGNADYAAANGFLDAHARAETGRERWTVSVQWPAWSEVGMAARSEAAMGLIAGAVRGKASTEPAPTLVRKFVPGRAWELDEHVFEGRPVLPGTALLELAVVAARESGHYPEGTSVRLRDVVFYAPVVGEAAVEVAVHLYPLAGAHRFRIRSRVSQGGSTWTEHAGGTITNAAQSNGSLAAPPSNGRVESAEGEAHRAADNPAPPVHWIDFGERWHCEAAVRESEGERAAELVLAERFQADLVDHPFHPAIMDVAAAVLSGRLPGTVYAPFHYREVVVHAPVTARVTVRARFADSARQPPPVDFDVCDTETGRLLVSVRSYSVREVAVGTFGVQAPAPEPAAPPATDRDGWPDMLRPEDGAQILLELLSGSYPPVVSVNTTSEHHPTQRRPEDQPSQVPPAAAKPAAAPPPPVEQPPTPATSHSPVVTETVSTPKANADERTDEATDELTAGLRELWIDAFGLDDIGLEDDFFELGGTSMTAVQLVSRISERYGIELGVGTIFEVGTLRGLAEELRVLHGGGLGGRQESVTAKGSR